MADSFEDEVTSMLPLSGRTGWKAGGSHVDVWCWPCNLPLSYGFRKFTAGLFFICYLNFGLYAMITGTTCTLEQPLRPCPCDMLVCHLSCCVSGTVSCHADFLISSYEWLSVVSSHVGMVTEFGAMSESTCLYLLIVTGRQATLSEWETEGLESWATQVCVAHGRNKVYFPTYILCLLFT